MFKANDLDKLKDMGFQVKQKEPPKDDVLCETAKKILLQQNVLSKIAGKNREVKDGKVNEGETKRLERDRFKGNAGKM